MIDGRLAAVAGAAMLAGAAMAAGEARATGAVAVHEARVEVSLQARQVSFYDADGRVATYPIAVGSDEWPTRTGEWEIYQIDFNPDWTPPAEGWASDEPYRPAGHPENPMGRIRMVYDPPRSIHGTDEVESIGEAVSHGSIRIRNEDGYALARRLMAASGDTRGEEFWSSVRENESEMVTVELSAPVPIRVREE